MFTPPRITPHELVHDDSLPKGEEYELDVCEYGECYEPNSTLRVHQAPEIRPSGHQAYLEGAHEHVDDHGEQPYYAKDTRGKGNQGAGS